MLFQACPRKSIRRKVEFVGYVVTAFLNRMGQTTDKHEDEHGAKDIGGGRQNCVGKAEFELLVALASTGVIVYLLRQAVPAAGEVRIRNAAFIGAGSCVGKLSKNNAAW